MDFLQKPSAWFSKFYFLVQRKIALETVFLFSFSEFFRILSKIFLRLSAKKLQKFVKTNFCVFTGTTCGFKFFLKVLNHFGFSTETFGMFLKVLSTCPDENLRKKYFFLFFLSEFFSDFERKTFQTFGQKTSRICKNYLLRVRRNNLLLDFFLSFETFRIFCRNIWHGSQNSIYVSRVKIAEEIVFFVFLFRIYSNFEQKFFRLLAKKLQEIVKTTFCVCRRTFFSLKKLLKVLNLFGFSAETFGMVLKILFPCPE